AVRPAAPPNPAHLLAAVARYPRAERQRFALPNAPAPGARALPALPARRGCAIARRCVDPARRFRVHAWRRSGWTLPPNAWIRPLPVPVCTLQPDRDFHSTKVASVRDALAGARFVHAND